MNVFWNLIKILLILSIKVIVKEIICPAPLPKRPLLFLELNR